MQISNQVRDVKLKIAYDTGHFTDEIVDSVILYYNCVIVSASILLMTITNMIALITEFSSDIS